MLEKVFQTSGVTRYSIRWRKFLHKLIIWLSKKFHPFLRENKVKLVRNDFVLNGKPTIYAATHVFYSDIACATSTINDSAFLLFNGNAKKFIPLIDRVGIWLVGGVPVRREDKNDRQKSLNKLLQILYRRGNVLIFPEGSHNLSPNLLVKKLWWGLLEIAEKADANIVPIAIQRVGDEHCVIIGDKLEREKYPFKIEEIRGLRDEMATLAWELIEISPPLKREDITDDYWLSFIHENLLNYVPKVSIAEEESYDFIPKDEISLGRLLADLHGIKHKSMASDYEQHGRIERLIEMWTKPIKFRGYK